MEKNTFLSKLSFAVFLWMAITLLIGTHSESFKNFDNKFGFPSLQFLELPTAYTDLKALAVNAVTGKTVPPVAIPKDDLQCMAENIYYEAGNQSYVGKIAVGQVVLNRTKLPGFPATICGVIYDGSQSPHTTSCQFSWTCAPKVNIDKTGPFWGQSLKAAKELLYNKDKLIDITEGATNYHADYVNPVWAKQLHQVTKIDQHIFYKHI